MWVKKNPAEAVALLVWGVRMAAAIAIAAAAASQLSRTPESERWLLRLLIGAALIAALVSRNEVLAERYFMATVAMSAYVCARVSIRISALLVVCIAVLANVGMHGIYTLWVVFGDAYEVIPSPTLRSEMFAKIFYYPTPMLLDFGSYGYSDEVIFREAPAR